jgi:hypothetical protein
MVSWFLYFGKSMERLHAFDVGCALGRAYAMVHEMRRKAVIHITCVIGWRTVGRSCVIGRCTVGSGTAWLHRRILVRFTLR